MLSIQVPSQVRVSNVCTFFHDGLRAISNCRLSYMLLLLAIHMTSVHVVL